MEIFYVVAVVALAVLAVVGIRSFQLGWLPVAVTAAVALLIPLPIYGISTAIAKEDKQSYHEYWNGFELAATKNEIACYRDGICTHQYDCDPYEVTTWVTKTDSKGNTYSEPETHTEYHDCPYSTSETSYYVETTLGTYTIDSHVQTGERFRWDTPLWGLNIQNDPPAFWAEAKKRLDAGESNPVSKVNTYKNFILASDTTILKEFSDAIGQYEAEGLLVEPSKGVYNFYSADKAYFIGVDNLGLDTANLAKQVAHLGSAVGTDLQGDVHIVFVNGNKVKDPNEYAQALKAYWVAPERGKDAIAKNTFTLIVGVEKKDGQPVVKWANSFTGMPLGNEELIQQFRSSLPGTVIDDNFIGTPKFDLGKREVVKSNGVVESMFYGPHQFERVSMSGGEEDDNGSGFAYLSDEWQPDGALMTLIFVLSTIFMALVIGGGFMVAMNLRDGSKVPLRRY